MVDCIRYELCQTYPSKIYAPASANDQVVAVSVGGVWWCLVVFGDDWWCLVVFGGVGGATPQ